MPISGANTGNVNAPLNDLDAFKPSPPQRKIDDKAATLEAELLGQKAEFRRERFVYVFVIATLFSILMGAFNNWGLFFFSVIASTILLIAMAHWLDFPWVVTNLQRWHESLHKAFEKRANGKQEETEPLPAVNNTASSQPPSANTPSNSG